MKRKILSWILIFILLLSTNILTSANAVVSDTTIVTAENLQADFEDDSIIVVFKSGESDINRIVTEKDFPEFKTEKIHDLSECTRKFIAEKKAEKLEKIENASTRSLGKIEITDEEIIREYDIDAENFKNYVCIELEEKGKDKVLEAVEIMSKREDVLAVSPNYIMHICSNPPNDFYYEYDSQWAIDAINLPEAWDLTTGSNTVRVGVLDTGIDANHLDLDERINEDLSENFHDLGNALEDNDSHGTHVAGIIGAEGNNQIGIAGTCWDVELVSLRVFGDNGRTSNYMTVVKGILSANGKGIDILNFSGGSYTRYTVTTEDGMVYDPLEIAINDFNGLFVTVAGNGYNNDNDNENIADLSVNIDLVKHYPASYDAENIISVTSFNSSGSFVESEILTVDGQQKTMYYNFGPTTVDLAAPGSQIFSTIPNNDYIQYSGTSMAAPYVTGVAALMLSVNPNLTPVQIKDIIMATVDKHESLAGKVASGGKLNAYEAVRRASTYTVYDQPQLIGGGAFSDTATPWFNAATSSTRVMPADINGDGKDDIAGIDINGNICYTQSNGDGSYTAQRNITVSGGFQPSWFSSSYNQRVWFDDVNGDGYDDLMGISIAGKMYTALNKKNMTFGAVTMSSTGTAFVSSSGWFNTTHSGRVWTGDINGDNKADFIGISTAGHVYYALGNGSGGFNSEVKITMNTSYNESWFTTSYRKRIWLADVDADGDDDIIGVSNAGNISVAKNNGNYTFGAPADRGTTSFLNSTGWFSTNYTSRVWPADVTGDGRCDLVGISTAGDVYIQVANSTGTSYTQKKVLVVNGYNGGWFNGTRRQYLWPVDFNGDGKADFAGISTTGKAYTSRQSSNF